MPPKAPLVTPVGPLVILEQPIKFIHDTRQQRFLSALSWYLRHQPVINAAANDGDQISIDLRNAYVDAESMQPGAVDHFCAEVEIVAAEVDAHG